jgi:hypothetical protein
MLRDQISHGHTRDTEQDAADQASAEDHCIADEEYEIEAKCLSVRSTSETSQ